ncbi:MAG: hypothetical protein U0525_02220 [Patescibacteria group bacterium]
MFNNLINWLLKNINKLKGKWGLVLKIILGILVLSLATIYLYYRFPTIIRSGEKQIDTAVIAIAAIIILLPFLSEIEIFGVKFKKEIEEIKKETDEKIKAIEQRLLMIQSQNINQYFYPPKPDNELKILSDTAKEVAKDIPLRPQSKDLFYQVPKEIVILFSVRWKLRRQLILVYKNSINKKDNKKTPWGGTAFIDYLKKLTYSDDGINKLNTQQIITLLVEDDKLNKDIGEILNEMVAICDNAYFGGKVTDEQIAFIKDNEYIIDYLESL